MPREKTTKKETPVEELPTDVQKRISGTMPKRSRGPVEKPEFLKQRKQSMPGDTPIFTELFEDDMRVEELDLPSRGYPYGWDSGKIKIRPYQTSEQKIISTINDKNYNNVITKIMNACIIDPSPSEFPTGEYTLGDMVAILFWLRVNSWSPTYEYTGVTCSECGRKNNKNIEYDLTKVDFKYLDEIPPEPVEVKLNDRVVVYIRMLRRKDELESERILKRLENMKMQSEGDEFLQKYITCTEGIEIDGAPYEGNLDYITLMKFYEKVPSKHLEKIDDVHVRYIHGVSSIINYECPFCGIESEKLLPLTPDFFFQGL